VQLGWAQREDQFKTYIFERQRTKKEKIRRTAEKKIKLKAQREDNMLAWNKGDFYGRGLALRSQTMMEDAANEPPAARVVGAKRTTPTKCKCGLTDHSRISYGKCELNPKNIALREKAAAEEAEKVSTVANMPTDMNDVV